MYCGMDTEAEALVRVAACGGKKAFASVYEQWARPVLVFLTARLGRRVDAEDALQATFLAVWRDLAKLRRPERFDRWLFRIAESRAVDQMRRRREGLVADADVEDRQTAAGGPDGDPERLRALVEGLRPRTRTVLLLRTVEGWNAEEVGRALGISASTVRRHHARALDHLRRALSAASPDER